MTAKEIRKFRDTCRKLVESEERGKLLLNCQKNKIGLVEDEQANISSNQKLRVLGNKKTVLLKKHEEGVLISLKYKLKDNILYGAKLRKMRNYLRGRIEDSLGSNSHACKRLMKEVKIFKYRLFKKLAFRRADARLMLTYQSYKILFIKGKFLG